MFPGDLGKELKNLISMMDLEEAAEAAAASSKRSSKLMMTPNKAKKK
jgi:hypothetical protein